MGIVFILLKLPCSSQPRIIPAIKIMHINNALDIDSVQKNNVRSTDVTFWIKNTTARAARSMPSMSLTFISTSSKLETILVLMVLRKRLDVAHRDIRR